MLVALAPFVVVSVDPREPGDDASVIEVLPYNALEVDDPILVALALFVVVSVDP
jgi:hypothetical protein